MLPGKKYKPEDILQILKHRFWLVLVPFAVISAGTAVVVRLLPDTYQSRTTILVVPQRVPEEVVRSTNTTRLEERLQVIHETITSRTRLERVIKEFNLYADDLSSGALMEDVVTRMRTRHLKIDIGDRGDFFNVSFTGREPRTVMRVTERLAGSIIDESLNDRKIVSESANQFLEKQLEEFRRRLEVADQSLAAFRRQHASELPEQQVANVSTVRSAFEQIRIIQDQIEKDQIRRQMFESALAELERGAENPTDPAVLPPTDPRELPALSGQIQRDIAALQAHIAVLKQQGKGEAHWEVTRARKMYDSLKTRAEAEMLSAPLSTASVSPAEQRRQKQVADVKAQIQLVALSISSKLKDLRELQAQATLYQQRVDAAPQLSTEMQKLTRDYDTMSQMYTDMLSKKEESRISANLETNQIGETFKIIDRANFPERPISPDRPRLNMMGMVAGLAVGLGLVVLLEYRDSSFKTDDEIFGLLALPVLAVVPLMQSDTDRRRSLRRRLLVGVGLGSTVVCCLALLAYTFIR